VRAEREPAFPGPAFGAMSSAPPDIDNIPALWMNNCGPWVLTVEATNELAPVRGSKRVVPMCEKCSEIDKTIARYQRVLLAIDDRITVDRTKELIAELQAQKAELHPEPERRGPPH
jgi:hypothetical protein